MSGHLGPDKSLDDYVYPRIISDSIKMEAKLRQTQIAQPAIGAWSVEVLAGWEGHGLATSRMEHEVFALWTWFYCWQVV